MKTAAAAVGIGAAAAALPTMAPARSARFSARFRTIDVHGALQVYANGVNDGGAVLGTFLTKTRTEEYIKSGRHLTKFAYPNASTLSAPGGINDKVVAVGYYGNWTSAPRGWIRFHNGEFRQINDPRAAEIPGLGTIVMGINDEGVIVGDYGSAAGSFHGFIDDHGKFRTVNVPGAGAAAGQGTFLTGINDSGEIVGYYTDRHERTRGFLYRSGRFFKFSAPQAAGGATLPSGISRNGTIVGTVSTPGARYVGWIRIGGRFSKLNDPHSAHGPGLGTRVFGINENGTLACGHYTDRTGAAHAWVATLSG